MSGIRFEFRIKLNVPTYPLSVNENGEAVYVKWHLKTDQGIKNLPASEADRYSFLYAVSNQSLTRCESAPLAPLRKIRSDLMLTHYLHPPSIRIASSDPDYAIRDLYNAIGESNLDVNLCWTPLSLLGGDMRDKWRTSL
jgi:Catalase